MKRHTVKEYYTEALFELLKKKPLSEITVSDLVKKSGASRASFYRNYLTKEQIIDEYLDSVFSDMSRDHPLSSGGMREEVCAIFRDLLAHRERFRVLREAGLLDRLDRFLYRNTLSEIQRLNVLNNKYQPHFFAGATAALIKAWIEYDFAESPEEMTEIFFRSLAGYMTIE